MELDDRTRRYSYQKEEFLAILKHEYTETLIKQISEDEEYEFLRNVHKVGLKRFANKKLNDDSKGAGLLLCPEKRSWTTGCHVEANNNSKNSSSHSQSSYNFIRGSNPNSIASNHRPNNRFVRGLDQNQCNDQNKTRSIMGPGNRQNEFRRNGAQNQGTNTNFNRSRGGPNVGGLFTRNNYQPKNRHTDPYGDNDVYLPDEEEPEWFSEGPTSFRDTIELRGMIEGNESESELKSDSTNSYEVKSDISETDKRQEPEFKLPSAEKLDQGGSRLLQLIGPKKPDAIKNIEERKEVESKLRSLLIRSDEGSIDSSQTTLGQTKALTLEEIESCGPSIQDSPGKTVSPLKNFLNSFNQGSNNVSTKPNRPQPTAGASRIFSMITEVAQQNARKDETRSSSFDSDTGLSDNHDNTTISPNVPTMQVSTKASDMTPSTTAATMIESLFENSPIKTSMVCSDDSSNPSALLSRFGTQPNDPSSAFLINKAPPPGFGIPQDLQAPKTSSILSSLNVASAPPGLNPTIPATGDGAIMFGGMKFIPGQQRSVQSKPQSTEAQNIAFARLLNQVQQIKAGAANMGAARAIVKQRADAGFESKVPPQSFMNYPAASQNSAFQATPPGFSNPHSTGFRRPIASGQQASNSRAAFIPHQVHQQMAAKAKTNGGTSSSILQCRLHLEQQKALGADHVGLGRPITSDKTLPAGQNHF